MAFGSNTNTSETGNTQPQKTSEDWNNINLALVEACGLEDEEVLVGVVSGIHDLGLQKQEDAKIEWNGTPEQEEAAIEEYPNTYFEDDKKEGKRYKRFPSKPQHCANISIDFPDIMVNKGGIMGFEGSEEAPLRIMMGGSFTTKATGKILGNTFSLRQQNNDKTNNQWSLPYNNTFYKMAVDSGIVKKGEPFTKFRIDELLGKSFQFKAQVFMKENKGKKYYTEIVKYIGKLGRKDEPLELDEKYQHLVHFQMDNDETALKQLRKEVINTMQMAEDFDDSMIKGQLIKLGKIVQGGGSSTPSPKKEEKEAPQEPAKASSPNPKAKAKAPAKKAPEPSVEDDEDSPF